MNHADSQRNIDEIKKLKSKIDGLIKENPENKDIPGLQAKLDKLVGEEEERMAKEIKKLFKF